MTDKTPRWGSKESLVDVAQLRRNGEYVLKHECGIFREIESLNHPGKAGKNTIVGSDTLLLEFTWGNGPIPLEPVIFHVFEKRLGFVSHDECLREREHSVKVQ